MEYIKNQEEKLNDIYLIYADQVCKNRNFSNNECIEKNREMLNFTKEIKDLVKERNLIIECHIKKIQIKNKKYNNKNLTKDENIPKNNDFINLINKVIKEGDFVIKCLLCNNIYDGILMKKWYLRSKTCPYCSKNHLDYKKDFIYFKYYEKTKTNNFF